MFVKLDERKVLEFCEQRGFRVSVRAFWELEAAVIRSGLSVGEVLGRAGELGKKVITEADMKEILKKTAMKDTSMEYEYSEEDEIKRLRQLIQIILNKH